MAAAKKVYKDFYFDVFRFYEPSFTPLEEKRPINGTESKTGIMPLWFSDFR